MLISIEAIVAELGRIPRAVWHGSHPAKPPVLRPRSELEARRVGHGCAFDDSGFNPPSSPRWKEAVAAVGGRIAPEAGGSVPIGPVGVDALAWYVSFHSSPDRWGIYIPLSSLPITDELYFSHLPMPTAERWRLVWDVLIAHEATHFAVDWACAWFELLHHAPLRRVLHDRMEAAGPGGGATLPRSSYFETEEALANGNVLRTVAPAFGEEVGAALRRFIRTQPPGYRDGEAAEADAGFAVAAAETLRGYLAVWSTAWNVEPGNPALDLTRLLPIGAKDRAACPIWILNDLEAAGLPADAVRLFMCVRPIEETAGFEKALKRLHLERAWQRTKSRLAESITPGHDFKMWPKDGKGAWSVRVNDSVRAHLRQPVGDFAPSAAGDPQQPWLAYEIGGHGAMGHGA